MKYDSDAVYDFYESRYKKNYKGGYSSDRVGKNRFKKILRRLSKSKKIDENWCVLDIGCSIGEFLNFLPFKYKYGVDISSKAVDIARQRGVEAYVCNVEFQELPFDNNAFDIVFGLEVLEHLFSPDNLMSELKRIMKPDGIICVSVPNGLLRGEIRFKILLGKIPFGVRTQHIRFFSKKILEELFTSSGFDVIFCSGLGPLSPRGFNLPFTEFFVKVFPDFLPRHYLLIARNKK